MLDGHKFLNEEEISMVLKRLLASIAVGGLAFAALSGCTEYGRSGSPLQVPSWGGLRRRGQKSCNGLRPMSFRAVQRFLHGRSYEEVSVQKAWTTSGWSVNVELPPSMGQFEQIYFSLGELATSPGS